MSETIIYHDLSLAGETGLKLYLRKNDGTLLNTGGDAFTDLGSAGVFTATLAESRVGLGTLHARICEGTETAENSVYEEFLPESVTVIGSAGDAVLNAAGLEAIAAAINELLSTEHGADSWEAGNSQTATIVTLQSVASISPGVIVGPTEPLVIGDDYLTVMNRSIRVNLLDENGDPAEVDYGTYALDDSGISIYLLLARSGKPSVEAQIFGTCTFFPAEEVDSVLIPPYLIVEFTKVETAKAVPGAYDMQAEAVWQDGKVVTFAPYGQIQFARDIRRA